MKLTKTLTSIAALLALTGPAAAQMYPGQDVIVNPGAIPGGPYGSGSSGYTGPIYLHMPRKHRHVAKVVKPDATEATTASTDSSGTTTLDSTLGAPATQAPDTTAAPATPPPAKPPHHKHPTAEAAATPPPAATPAPDTTQPTGDMPLVMEGDAPVPVAPPPSKSSKHGTKVASTEAPPADTSTAATPATPPATDAAHQNLFKHGAVMFVAGATDPSPAQFDGVKTLAADLNAALEAGAARVQLEAYGGAPGDKSSDARRLSLKRALAIRQLLIDDGVPSSRIDVRAMGGTDDKGSPDRVDVFVRAS